MFKTPLKIYDVLLADWQRHSLSCPQGTKSSRSILPSTSCVQLSKELQMYKFSSLELIVQGRKPRTETRLEVGWMEEDKRNVVVSFPTSPS